MEAKRNITIRAATAALLFSGLIYLLTGSSPRPLPRFIAAGNLWFEDDRILRTESALMSSDAASMWKKSARGEAFFSAYSAERERLKTVLGDAFDWIGFGPWRVALTLDDDGSPIIVVGAGNMAVLGDTLFKSSGFVHGAPVGNYDALQKGDLVYARVKGFWIVGKRDGVGKAARVFDGGTGLSAWNMSSWRAQDGDGALVAVSPEYLRKIVAPSEPSPNFEIAMKEWTDWDEWSGVVFSFEARGNKIVGDGWTNVEDNSPVAEIWQELGKGDSSSDWVNSRTVFAVKAAIENPDDFWAKARRIYANHPIPTEILNGVESQLKNELGIELSSLLGELGSGSGFANVTQSGKPHTVLFSGARKSARNEFGRMESAIKGEWVRGFEGLNIRYMPRLLAYTFKNDMVFLAANPQILADYLKKPDVKSALPGNVLDAISAVSSKPLAIVGRLPKAVGSRDAPVGVGWYAAGIERSQKQFIVRFVMPANIGKAPSIPLKIRLLGFAAGAATFVGWIAAVISFAVFSLNSYRLILNLIASSRS